MDIIFFAPPCLLGSNPLCAVIWFAVAAGLVMIEATALGLFYCLAFAFGCTSAGIAALFHLSIFAQLCICVAVTILSFIVLQKFKTSISRQSHHTNVHALIGKKGIVTKTIPPQNFGYIRVGRETWSARSNQDHPLPEGRSVTVINISGNNLVVHETHTTRE